MKRGQFKLINYGNACLAFLFMLLLALPAIAQEEAEYYPVEEYEYAEDEYNEDGYYEEEDYAEEAAELPEPSFEDETEKAGITSNNWILSPFDALGEKLHYLFLFSSPAKIEYTLKRSEERDYEIRLLNRKIEKKAEQGYWEQVEKFSEHLAKTNENYNELLLEADEQFSLLQEEEDEETIDSIYNEAMEITDRHTVNIIQTRRFVGRYTEQGGVSSSALQNLNAVVEYEGLAEEVAEEQEPLIPEIPSQQIPPAQVRQLQQPSQKKAIKQIMQKPKQQLQAMQQIQQPAPIQTPKQKSQQTKPKINIPTGFITAAINTTKGFLHEAVDYIIQTFNF